jgi:hypothetical protein
MTALLAYPLRAGGPRGWLCRHRLAREQEIVTLIRIFLILSSPYMSRYLVEHFVNVGWKEESLFSA